MFTHHDQGRARRAPLAALALGALCVAALALPPAALAAARTPVAVTFTKLKLINGWKNVGLGTSTAEVAVISGIVTFRGTITTAGSSTEPFVLPKAFRPARAVYVPIDLSFTNNGRLLIKANGAVFVQAEGGTIAHAKFQTSLDGASFAKSATGFTALKLRNGWTNAPFGTANAKVRVISGIVHFKGAIATSGSNPQPFVLPRGFRPAALVYVNVDLCGANNGRLVIFSNGEVVVNEEDNIFANAACFTSLDGASFALSGKSFTALKLRNGWHGYGSGTAKPAARVISGVVYLRGAIATSSTNTNNEPFVLPQGFRPTQSIRVPVDLCNANHGDLVIQPNGAAFLKAEIRFSDLQCFTSLDGVSFAK